LHTTTLPCRRCVQILTRPAYEIRQGTVDQKEADVEWLLRPYMRTAKKRNQI
jgi:hypothetical protein